MRKALTMLLLGVLFVQLGPACGFGNSAAMDSMQCCQTALNVKVNRDVGSCINRYS